MKTPARLPLLLALLVAPFVLRAENLAVTGGTVYTMSGAPLKNGVVLIRDGKIEAVGPAHSLTAMARYLNNRAGSSYGGSNEIQRDIMARRVLGL